MKHVLIKLFCGLTTYISLIGIAWAQTPGGQVTYRPVDYVPVPALSGFAMVLLGVFLAILAWRIGRSGRWMNRVSSVAVLTMTAVVSLTIGVKNIHAGAVISEVLIQGNECNIESTEYYDPFADGAVLTSECGNRVEVVSNEITADCTPVIPNEGACTVGSQLNPGGSCALSVCESGPVVEGACQGGALNLSTSPGGDMVVCDDPTDTVCEQDVETLCPVGWQLCSYQQHTERNAGWTYPLTPAQNVVVAEIYCRASGGAGHFTLGTYNNPADLSVDIPLNCHYGSSRESCTTDYGCNETSVQALCCLPSPSCGNGVVDSPEEQCDDGNQDETDTCLNSCTLRFGGSNC